MTVLEQTMAFIYYINYTLRRFGLENRVVLFVASTKTREKNYAFG